MTIPRIGSSNADLSPEPTYSPAHRSPASAVDTAVPANRDAIRSEGVASQSAKRKMVMPDRTVKRIHLADPEEIGAISPHHITASLTQLGLDVEANFLPEFKRLLQGNVMLADKWMIPDHHCFMAALCQSVSDSIEKFSPLNDIATFPLKEVNACFRTALKAIGRLERSGNDNDLLKAFLNDTDHLAYRELVNKPDQFDCAPVETARVFRHTAALLKQINPDHDIQASQLWKLCVDPQTIELMRQKKVNVDSPLVGALLFEGQSHFLYNRARGWEYIAQAVIDGDKTLPSIHRELHAVLSGQGAVAHDNAENSKDKHPPQTDSEDKESYLVPGTVGFDLLEGHTLTKEGFPTLEKTLGELKKLGLKIVFEKAELAGANGNYYQLRTTILPQHVKRLENWINGCFRQHATGQQQASSADEAAINDFTLAIRLNQAHFLVDHNIGTNMLMVNYLHLLRGEKPFAVAEPNALDGHTAQQLLIKKQHAYADYIEVPRASWRHAAQNKLVTLTGPRTNPWPKRNTPISNDFLQFRDHVKTMRVKDMYGQRNLMMRYIRFTEFLQQRGLTPPQIKQDRTAFSKFRHDYLKIDADSSRISVSDFVQRSRFINDYAAYAFPDTEMNGILRRIIIKSGIGTTKHISDIDYALREFQEFLYAESSSPETLQHLLQKDQAHFFRQYESYLAYLKDKRFTVRENIRSHCYSMAARLRPPIVKAFFPSSAGAQEQQFLKDYRQFWESLHPDVDASSHINEVNSLKIKHAMLHMHSVSFEGFIRLYGNTEFATTGATTLHHLGYFLFPDSRTVTLFEQLMDDFFSDRDLRTPYLAASWRLEWFLRKKTDVDGIASLELLGLEQGKQYIDNFLHDNQTSLVRLNPERYRHALMSSLFPEYQPETSRILDDIKLIEDRITDASASKNRVKALSTYTLPLKDFAERVPDGMQDNDLSEFLVFRSKILSARDQSINPVPEKLKSSGTFYSVMCFAAQVRYPALLTFTTEQFASPRNTNKFISFLLNYFTYLQESTEQTDAADITQYFQHINANTIDAYWDDDDYLVPSGLIKKDKFKEIMKNFPTYWANQNTSQ